ncbi:MAG: P1 family peptidase [Vicinamibacterales bacterium]
MRRPAMRLLLVRLVVVTALPVALGTGATTPHAQGQRLRARELGITIGSYPTGPLNAITDVEGVRVGHATIVRGEGRLTVGRGPVRTGVTAVLARPDIWYTAVFAATHTLNGDGEMTGTHWIRDLETLAHPILITNTGSVGAVHDAALAYISARHPTRDWGFLPVVAETWDGTLNDIAGRHVGQADVFAALDAARGGPVAEGNVGGGTGVICFRFKCGIGTSSRRLPAGDGGYTVGVLVQANFGGRDQLRVDGVPVGREISDLLPTVAPAAPPAPAADERHEGSVIVVVATDAPLSSRQLERVARRATLGLARTGSTSGNTSGDIVLAFSTGNAVPMTGGARVIEARLLSTDHVEPIFRATADATEEAVLNALFKAETMSGINGNTVQALPYDRLRQVMAAYGRALR